MLRGWAFVLELRPYVDPDEPAVHADDEAVLRGRAAFETLTFDEWARQMAMPAGPLRDGLQTMTAHYNEHGFHGGNSIVLKALLGREPLTVPAFIEELARA